MDNSIFIGLIQNIAVLLAFSMIYDYAWAKNEDIRKKKGKILAGIFIGLVAIFLMMIPWTLSPGLQFDSRSILLSVSGLFFGPLPTAIAMVIAAAYRLYLGGSGMWMGVAVILSAGFIGIIWGQFYPPKKIKKPQYNILIMGLIVHVVMLLCTFFLPRGEIVSTIKAIILPLFLLYTPGTMLLGMLMLKRWQFWRQQRQAAEEENRYQQLFENAAEAILVAQDGYIRFSNQRLCDILEAGYDEIRAVPFIDFIHPDDREFVLGRHKERIEKKIDYPDNYSFRIISRSGQIKWLEINAVLFEWKGEPASLGFLSDVTSFRETSRQLVLAKKKAEESDLLKTVFLANMSHEIRTPMNAILGFSELLQTTASDHEKQSNYIGMIQTAGKQLLAIINDIVDISKLEVNQLSINIKNASLFEIFEQSVEAFKNHPLFKQKKDIELKLDFPENCKEIRVMTDPYRIRQVIDNLLSNAVKYTDKGLILLSCTGIAKKDHIDIEVHVKDTGLGIPEDKKHIIFERFRQVEEHKYREGAGLGLSICKGILELLGGKMGFESTEGKGSDFYFNLRLERAEFPPEEPRPLTTRIPNLQDVHILIAEDDLTSYYLIKEYLADTHARVSHAVDGEVLMQMLENDMPEIVLLDINMPKKDGYACLEEINEKDYPCKIIAQTAYAMENEKEHCMRSGCQGYVSKPIDPDVLYDEIRRVLRQT